MKQSHFQNFSVFIFYPLNPFCSIKMPKNIYDGLGSRATTTCLSWPVCNAAQVPCSLSPLRLLLAQSNHHFMMLSPVLVKNSAAIKYLTCSAGSNLVF